MPRKNHPHRKLATGKQARQETRARHGYSPHSSSSSAAAAPSCGAASAGEGEGAAMVIPLALGLDCRRPLRSLVGSPLHFESSSFGRWESIPASDPPTTTTKKEAGAAERAKAGFSVGYWAH